MSKDPKIEALLRKIAALAERGVGGETTLAKIKLNELCKKHGINMDSVLSTEKAVRFSFVSKEHQTLFFQILAVYIGTKNIRFRRIFGKRMTLELVMTRDQHIRVQSDLDFFWAHYKEDMKAFKHAFLMRNHLCPKPDPDEPPQKMDIAESERIFRCMSGLNEHKNRKRIGES